MHLHEQAEMSHAQAVLSRMTGPESRPAFGQLTGMMHQPLHLWCSAVINRYGFNSKGVDAVRANLLSYRRGLLQRPVNKPGGLPGLVGVNLGTPPLHSLAPHCLA